MRHYHQPNEELPKLQAEENYPERIRAAILRDGFSVQAVLGDAKTPVVAYSIGLVTSRSHSEFIVLANEYADALAVLNGIATMVRRGLVITPDSVIEGINNQIVKVETVDRKDGLAVCPVFRWIYPDQTADVKFFQLHLSERPNGRANGSEGLIPTSGTQDVKSYLRRTAQLRL